MSNYRRFRFVKPLSVNEGSFRVNDEITILDNRIYFNGGMVMPTYHSLLRELVEYELETGFKYLREVPIPYNKV